VIALIVCPICSRSYRTLYGLKYHFKAAHADALSSCPICGKGCRNADGLKLHCSWMMRRGCAEHGALYYLLSDGAWISRRLGAFKGEVFEVLRCGGLGCLRRSCALTVVAT
jgi:hypothetical protein